MKLESLFLEKMHGSTEHKQITILGKEFNIKEYLSIEIKQKIADEICNYIFNIEKNEDDKITSLNALPDIYLREILTTYYILKNYVVDLEAPKTEDGFDDLVKIYNMDKTLNIVYAIQQVIASEIYELIELIDDNVEHYIELQKVNREEKILGSLENITSNMDTIFKQAITRTSLELEELKKQIDLMPSNEDEFIGLVKKMKELNINPEEVGNIGVAQVK